MKKSLSKLIVPVQSKTAATKRSSRTIAKFINKVPANKELLDKPSPAAVFVAEQMQEYPLPPKAKPSKRQQLLSQKIKLKLQQNQKVFNELLSKLQEKLTYFELEDMRELLTFMSEKQINENKIGLKKLKHTVNYFLESSSENVLIEDYIMESADKLLEELREAQKKKVNLVI